MKRLSLAAASAALAVCLLPLGVSAYVPSPQYGAFEIKFGPYRPNVDDQPGLTGTPYASTFGKKESMFLTTLEVDWQFFRFDGIISFGVGGSFGFMQEYARSQTVSGAESNDYTVLNVIPFTLVGVIRVDVLADQLGVPLVPYFKGGLNWYLWWILGAGDTQDSGGTPGWQISPGIALRLDGFDRMSARTFDNETGVNHSFIFFEYVYAIVEGLGQTDHMFLSPMNMGSHGTWLAGLGIEF
jgi:hypothetical protein